MRVMARIVDSEIRLTYSADSCVCARRERSTLNLIQPSEIYPQSLSIKILKAEIANLEKVSSKSRSHHEE